MSDVAFVGLYLDMTFFRVRPKIGWSGAVNGRCRKTMERSGARSSRSRSGNGAGSGGYRNRLERGAAFSPLTLRSHVLLYHINACFHRGVAGISVLKCDKKQEIKEKYSIRSNNSVSAFYNAESETIITLLILGK